MAEEKMQLWVQSVDKDGFRRLGRWFGPELELVEVTEEQAAILAQSQSKLRLMTPEAKEQLDALQSKFSGGVEAIGRKPGQQSQQGGKKPAPQKSGDKAEG